MIFGLAALRLFVFIMGASGLALYAALILQYAALPLERRNVEIIHVGSLGAAYALLTIFGLTEILTRLRHSEPFQIDVILLLGAFLCGNASLGRMVSKLQRRARR